MKPPHPVAGERRRSQRIALSVPVFVLSLDTLSYCGHLQIIEVSGHGCVLHALRPFKRDTRLRLDLLHSNRTTTGRVVHSDPIGMHLTSWAVALELDEPGNFWKVQSPPPDWLEISERSRSMESPHSGFVRMDRENQ